MTGLFLIGCGVDPRTDVDAVNHLLTDHTRPATMPSDGNLTFAGAVALANARSETLGIQGEAYIRSVMDKRRAVAAFLPTIGLDPSDDLRRSASGGDPGASGTSSTVTKGGYDSNLDIPVELDLVIFDGLQNVNSYWRDVYLIERQRDLLLDAQEQLISDVAQVYYGVLRSEAQVRVLENSLKVQEERLRDTQGRAKVGFARALDVAQTQAQVSSTRVQLIEARRQVQDGRSTLAYLLNAPVEELKLSDQYSPDDALAPTPELLSTATAHRSEILASTHAIEAARRDVKVATGEYYPTLSLHFSTWLYRETAPTQRTWDNLLSLSIPIFSGGSIDADVRTAWSFLREALLMDSQARRRVRREVEQGVRDIQASQQRLEELQVQLSAAREAYRQAQASYEAGRATNLERVQAQDVLLQAELTFATEGINQKLLHVALLRSTGMLRETLLDLPTPLPTHPALPATRPVAPTTQTAIHINPERSSS